MRALLLPAVLLASSVLAQSEAPKLNPKAPVQKVNFGEGDLIEGGLQHPMGEIYMVPTNPKFSSLIKVRVNFDDKLRASVHEM